MKVIADANVLLRAVTNDDERQAALAIDALRRADQIVVTIPTLCEFVWVLEKRYRRPRAEVARSIRALVGDRRAVFDRSVVMAGLALHDAGGDFADGVIAFEGRQLGGDVFLTFNKKAARLIGKSGGNVELLSSI